MNKLISNIAKKLIGSIGYELQRKTAGVYRPQLANEFLFKKIGKDQPVIFDVGANTGQSIDLFKKGFFCPVIYSFEPDEECFKSLNSKYLEDKKVCLFNIALGDIKGTGDLYKDDYNPINSLYKINKSSSWYEKVIK